MAQSRTGPTRPDRSRVHSFRTLKGNGQSCEVPVTLDIILVHQYHLTDEVEKSLEQSAGRIGEKFGQYRLHRFSFNTIALLQQGQGVLLELGRCLRKSINTILERQRTAIIAHNIAAWVVRSALVQCWQIDRDVGNVPVALIDFALPRALTREHWASEETWTKYRDNLLAHLVKRTKVKQEKVGPKTLLLSCSTQLSIVAKFEDLDEVGQIELPTLTVPRSDTESVPSMTSGRSDGNRSSTASKDNSNVTISPEEEKRITTFLENVLQVKPSPIPSLPEKSSSRENKTELPLALHNVSEGRNIGSINTPSRRTSSTASHSTHTSDSDLGSTDSVLAENIAPTKQNIGTEPAPIASIWEQNLKTGKRMASSYMRTGNIDQANRLYRNVISGYEEMKRFDRSYRKMKMRIGQIYCIRGDYKSSEEILQQLLNEEYKQSVVQSSQASLASEIAQWLSLSQWKQSKYTDAQNTINACLEKLPEDDELDPNLSSTLALVLSSVGSFKRAWQLSTSAINQKRFVAFDLSNGEDALFTQRSTCLINHARISYAVGKLNEADKKFQEALKDLQKHFGRKHFITLEASSLQARLLVVQGKTPEASIAVQEALSDLIKQFGGYHPLTIQAFETLVLVYMSEGRYLSAECIAEDLIYKSKQVLGESHPQTLRSQVIFAEILLFCGRWEEAEKQTTEAINAEKSKTPANQDFQGLFLYQTTLAKIYREKGKWDDARTLSVQVLVAQLNKFCDKDKRDKHEEKDKDRVLGTVTTGPKQFPAIQYIPARLTKLLDSYGPVKKTLEQVSDGLNSPLTNVEPVLFYPSIIRTMHCLALCEQVRDDADLKFSGGMLKMLRDIHKSILGQENRLTMDVQYDLAVNYRRRGKYQTAFTLIQEVVDSQRALDRDHPEYLRAKYQEAIILLGRGKWREALQEQGRTLKAREYLLGKTHPDTVLSRYALGNIYMSLRYNLEEADDLLQQVIAEQTHRYGKDHPLVLRSRAQHALLLRDRGTQFLKQAETEQKTIVEALKMQHGPHHKKVHDARHDLAQIIRASRNRNDLQTALDIYKEIVHELPEHFEARLNIATLRFELGEYDQAEDAQREIYKELKTKLGSDKDPHYGSSRLISSAFNLALMLQQHKTKRQPDRLTESCVLLQEAVEHAQEFYGYDHPESLNLRATLCEWQREEEMLKIGHAHTKSLHDSVLSVVS